MFGNLFWDDVTGPSLRLSIENKDSADSLEGYCWDRWIAVNYLYDEPNILVYWGRFVDMESVQNLLIDYRNSQLG